MALKVIGAGYCRTGTMSMKLALEQLLGAPCYHMHEVFLRPDDVPIWHSAALGEPVDWDTLFTGYAAEVDWPASLFWPELMAAYPEAKVVLSVRDSEGWWRSAKETVFTAMEQSRNVPERKGWNDMIDALVEARFTSDLTNKDACIALFERNTEMVRSQVPAERLIVWEPGDGWGPLCEGLNIAVPETPYPLTNTKDEFVARLNERR